MTVTAAPVALRPRTGPEIIDAAISLLRLGYAACVAVWLGNLIIYHIIWLMAHVPTWPVWYRYAWGYFMSAVPVAILERILSDVYVGRPIHLPRVVAAVCRRAPNVIGVYVARCVLVGLGLCALIVPGVVAWAHSFAAVLAVVVDDNTPMDAMDRSWRLTRGHLRRTTLVLGVTLLIVLLLWVGIAELHGAAATHQILTRPLRQGLALVLYALVAPIAPAVVVVLYYDLRIRQEGLDLELMAQALCAPGAP